MDTFVEFQGGGGNGRESNRETELERSTKEVAVTAELRADVSAHGLWKQETNAMFDIRIVNLDVVSYLCRIPKKALVKA